MGKPRLVVMLRYGLEPEPWRARHRQGEVADETPYAYHLAGEWFDLAWSVDHPERWLGRMLRTVIRRAAGFDMVHVWRNREALRQADAVWTHTEREHLAVAMLRWLQPRKHRATTIAQSVWLWDQWPSLNPLRARLYSRLLRQNDVEVVLSRVNRDVSRSAVPGRKVLRLPFGTHPAQHRKSADRLSGCARVLAVGNDRHRDWALLLESARRLPELTFDVVTLSKDVGKMAWPPNVRVCSMAQSDVLNHAYPESSVVALPLMPNLHASGCTVAIEAISSGVPIVATNTGGIDEYVADSNGILVAVNDLDAFVGALRRAAARSPSDVPLAGERGLTEIDYVRRLVLLTLSLLKGKEIDPAVEFFLPVPPPAEIEWNAS